MKKIYLIIAVTVLFAGCSKMEDKKPVTDNKNMPKQEMQNPHEKMGDKDNTQQTDMAPDTATDPKAEELSKAAYDFENNYKKDNSTKAELIKKHMTAGNYLMFEANLSPKKKYKPALKHYRRVLELDASNAEAQRNKTQIEEIYTSMGRPIPND